MGAISLFLALGILAAQATGPAPPRKQGGLPRYEDYPAGPIFHGKPDKVEWPADWRNDEYFRDAIQDLIDGGVNFAGHYALREWSCGTDCHWLILLDMKTGSFLRALPYGTLSVTYEDPPPYRDHDWLQVRPDSRLLIASGCFDIESIETSAECGTKYFELRGDRFSLVKYVPRPTPELLTRKTTINLNSKQPTQGSLIRVTVRSGVPLTSVQGRWSGHTIAFWSDDPHGTLYSAYLGVDLEQAPGSQELEVTVSPIEGLPSVLGEALTVVAGRFAVERLTLPEKYVTPSPEDTERAKKESERLHEIYAGRTPEKLWSGDFRFPLEGEPRGSNFGRRRVLNGQPGSPHGGLDIPAPVGAPIHAAQSGRVALAEELYFSGNTVVMDHGLGIFTFYGHLSKINVNEGDQVALGAVIGLVGATGRVTGPHLHWGLEVNEARVNPLQILPPPKKPRPAVQPAR